MAVHVREIEKEIGAETVKLIHDEAQRGGIASDAASQSDDEDSSIACFVKFSSAKLGKMNGQQFVMN